MFEEVFDVHRVRRPERQAVDDRERQAHEGDSAAAAGAAVNQS